MKTEDNIPDFNLEILTLESALEFASKSLDFPVYPMTLIEGTKNYRTETRISCRELLVITTAAQAYLALINVNSESETPETDAESAIIKNVPMKFGENGVAFVKAECVPSWLARKLEKERNEARSLVFISND